MKPVMTYAPLITTLVLGMAVALPVSAQWEGEAGAGLVRSSGNTAESSTSASADLSYETGQWAHNLLGDYYRSAEDGEAAQDRASIGYQADYDIDARWYGWAAVRYEQDEFADIDRRFAALIGAGSRFIDQEDHKLSVEVGVGGRDMRFLSERERSKEPVGSVGLNYRVRLASTTSVSQRLLVEVGDDNTLLKSITGLTVNLSERLALNLSYALRRNSDVRGPRGGKSNTLTTINLLLTF